MGAIVLDASKVNSYVLPNLVKSKNTMQDAYSTSQSLRNSLPSSFTYRNTINDIVNQLYSIKREISDIDTIISKKVEKAKTIENRNDNRASGIAKAASSIGSIVGTIGGAVIGSATGGVVGTVAGAAVGNKVGSAVGKGLANTGAKIVSGFVSGTKKFFSGIVDGFKWVGTKIYKIGSSIFEKISGWVSSFFTNVKKYVKDLFKDPWGTLLKTGASIVNVFIGFAEGIVSFAESLVDTVIFIAGGFVGSVIGLLIDLGQGLSQGEWDFSATGAAWKKVILPVIGYDFTGRVLFNHLNLDAYSYNWAKREGGTVYGISKGVGYVTGIILLTVLTAGTGTAANTAVSSTKLATQAATKVATKAAIKTGTQVTKELIKTTASKMVTQTMSGVIAGSAKIGSSMQGNYNKLNDKQKEELTGSKIFRMGLSSVSQGIIEGSTFALTYGSGLKNVGVTAWESTKKATLQFGKVYFNKLASKINDNDVKVFTTDTLNEAMTSAAVSFVYDKTVGVWAKNHNTNAYTDKMKKQAENVSAEMDDINMLQGANSETAQKTMSYWKKMEMHIADSLTQEDFKKATGKAVKDSVYSTPLEAISESVTGAFDVQ